MWEIYYKQGRWVLMGWMVGHIQPCLDCFDGPDWMLIPIQDKPHWITLCPSCNAPTIHYASTKCRKCGQYVDEREELEEWWQK